MNTPQSAAAAAPEKDDPTIWRVDDAPWTKLVSVLRIDKPRKKLGRPRRDDRVIFDGLICLAQTGSQWVALPSEFRTTSTVHLRPTEWVTAGALDRAWGVVLTEDHVPAGLDWARLAADGCIVKAPFGKRGWPARCRPPALTRPTPPSPAPRATS